MKKIAITIIITLSAKTLIPSQYQISQQRNFIARVQESMLYHKPYDIRGITPLHCAVLLKDYAKMHDALDDKNIHIDHESSKCMTSLYMAAALDDTIAVELLIERKADPYIYDFYGLKPYDITRSNQIKDMLKKYENECISESSSDANNNEEDEISSSSNTSESDY